MTMKELSIIYCFVNIRWLYLLNQIQFCHIFLFLTIYLFVSSFYRKNYSPKYAKQHPERTMRIETAVGSAAFSHVMTERGMPSTAKCWPRHSASSCQGGVQQWRKKLKSTTTINSGLVSTFIFGLGFTFFLLLSRKWSQLGMELLEQLPCEVEVPGLKLHREGQKI